MNTQHTIDSWHVMLLVHVRFVISISFNLGFLLFAY